MCARNLTLHQQHQTVRHPKIFKNGTSSNYQKSQKKRFQKTKKKHCWSCLLVLRQRSSWPLERRCGRVYLRSAISRRGLSRETLPGISGCPNHWFGCVQHFLGKNWKLKTKTKTFWKRETLSLTWRQQMSKWWPQVLIGMAVKEDRPSVAKPTGMCKNKWDGKPYWQKGLNSQKVALFHRCVGLIRS